MGHLTIREKMVFLFLAVVLFLLESSSQVFSDQKWI